MHSYVLLFSCPDQSGVVASVVAIIYNFRGNINDSIQHHDEESDTFFMRVEWEMTPEALAALRPYTSPTDTELYANSTEALELLKGRFARCIDGYNLSYQIAFLGHRPRVAIMVSKQLHCLYDLLLQWREDQLPCTIVAIISNHPSAEPVAKWFGLPFWHTPSEERAVEARQLQILHQAQVETVVLARYMRILSEDFVNAYRWQIINIHHSFLPAFVGAKPYHQAFERGVKIIGATSHYVTQALDQGPIIEQDVARVSHRDSVEDMVRKGKNLERTVLSQAVRFHVQRRVLVYGNKTIVFV